MWPIFGYVSSNNDDDWTPKAMYVCQAIVALFQYDFFLLVMHILGQSIGRDKKKEKEERESEWDEEEH